MTQRPDLFAVALPAVGVMDMLRFNQFTIGWAWTSDYGSPEIPTNSRHYMPIRPIIGCAKERGTRRRSSLLPITTTAWCPRTVSSSPRALQAAQAGKNPVLIRIETKAGHGAGKPTAKLIDEAADRWAFVVHCLKMKPQP